MLSLLANIKSALIEYVNKVIDFYTGNPIYSTLFLTAFLPVVAIVVYRWKRKTVANQSIINSAHDKSAHDKKVISLDKKKNPAARVVKHSASGKKKFVLVPHDEWLEFMEYKKSISDTQSQA